MGDVLGLGGGAPGLVTLPYFGGERCPILDPLARGTICGLTLSHGRGHLYRALLEATAYAARHILDFTPTRRHATDAQRRTLPPRDGGCVIAGCPAPAHWTVAHHCRPWEHHGPTDLTNLCLLCPTHHRTLHLQGWTAALEGGLARIVTSAGHEVPTRTRTGPVPARAPAPPGQVAA